MKRSFAEILKEQQDALERKAAAKLPGWAGADGLEFPGALCLEQCSGTSAACYKAGLFTGRMDRIADLTGGLGVDSHAFSSVFGTVLYFERNEGLALAAQRNFARLGAGNIIVRPVPFSLDEVRDFAPDWIYLDPARRSGTGRKVFLLEECEPDVMSLLPDLKAITPRIMLKLSPMADITMLRERLGQALREIHIVCVGGEVKELLCILGEECDAPARLVLSEDGSVLEIPAAFSVPGDSGEKGAGPIHGPYPQGSGFSSPEPGMLLLEPGAGLLKTGAFHLPCALWGMAKLDRFTHLYVCDGPVPSDATPFFKCFSIVEVLPFGKAEMARAGKRWPRAEVTARNIPMTSDELRRRLGVRTGSDIHIFGCTAHGEKLLIVSEKL